MVFNRSFLVYVIGISLYLLALLLSHYWVECWVQNPHQFCSFLVTKHHQKWRFWGKKQHLLKQNQSGVDFVPNFWLANHNSLTFLLRFLFCVSEACWNLNLSCSRKYQISRANYKEIVVNIFDVNFAYTDVHITERIWLSIYHIGIMF